MFDDIAKTYDVANRVLSFGVDKSWRKDACDKTFDKYNSKEIEFILDVACGTGDMCENWDKRDTYSSCAMAKPSFQPAFGASG